MNDLDFGLDGPGRFSIFLQGRMDLEDPKWYLEAFEQLRLQWNRPSLKRTKIEMVLASGYLETMNMFGVEKAILTCLFVAGIIGEEDDYCLGKIPRLAIEYRPNPSRVSLIRFAEMEDEDRSPTFKKSQKEYQKTLLNLTALKSLSKEASQNPPKIPKKSLAKSKRL